MKRSRAFYTCLALTAIAGLAFSIWLLFGRAPVTAAANSPNGEFRVALVETTKEWALQIDRNFDVRLTSIRDGATQTVFQSPDEGRPVGSERFIWTTDGSKFLLVGKEFCVESPITLGTGESAYLLYDTRTETMWLNVSQSRDGLPLTHEILADLTFAETIDWSRDDTR